MLDHTMFLNLLFSLIWTKKKILQKYLNMELWFSLIRTE